MKQFLTIPNPNCWINNSLLNLQPFFFSDTVCLNDSSLQEIIWTRPDILGMRVMNAAVCSAVSALHVQILSINVRRSSEGGGWQTVKAQGKSFLFPALAIWRDVLVCARRVQTLFPLFIFTALLPFPAKRLIGSRFTYVWTSRLRVGGDKCCSGLFHTKYCNFHSLRALCRKGTDA